MLPNVVEVSVRPQLHLELRFRSGEVKVFDARPYLNVGRFLELLDERLFAQAKVVLGTVEWPNGLDFDPEDLYELSVPV
ncbi:MAG: DUF2442 domain-containing protein [Spirochaetales bacterium]